MALWTPYADDAHEALDLSKRAVKAERGPRVPEAYTAAAPWGPPSPPASPEAHDTLCSDPRYLAFERDALRAMGERQRGRLLGCNPRMRRAVRGAAGPDEQYRRQRARNNAAAKQSRERRKLRELRLALQAAFLRRELAALRAALAAGSPCAHEARGCCSTKAVL